MAEDTDAVPDEVSIADDGPMIVATVRLAGCPADRALAAFTDPGVLARWWRGELSAELAPGGEYSVWFPAIAARLTGRVVGYVPGQSLQFSWAWEGEDDRPASTVTVRAESAESAQPVAAADATVLMIEHGPHAGDDAGRQAHAEHWAGWEFFLPRLHATLAIPADPG